MEERQAMVFEATTRELSSLERYFSYAPQAVIHGVPKVKGTQLHTWPSNLSETLREVVKTFSETRHHGSCTMHADSGQEQQHAGTSVDASSSLAASRQVAGILAGKGF